MKVKSVFLNTQFAASSNYITEHDDDDFFLRATHRGPGIRLYFCFAHSQNSDKQTIFSPQSAFVAHRSIDDLLIKSEFNGLKILLESIGAICIE